jgi:hypothetical protein
MQGSKEQDSEKQQRNHRCSLDSRSVKRTKIKAERIEQARRRAEDKTEERSFFDVSP